MARVEGVREFFVLKDAEARSDKLPADVRESVARDCTIARQRREAAEVLWLGGAPAEALNLAHSAFELVSSAYEREHAAGAAPELPAGAVDLRTKLAARPLPKIDAEVVDADTATFFALLAQHDALRARVVPASLSKPEIVQKRRSRLVWAAVSSVLAIAVLYYLFRTPRVIRVEASAVYDEAHGTAKAVDGRKESELLLPTGQTGWIDFNITPVRKLKRLKVTNGHNPPFNDRQIETYTLQIFGPGDKLLKTIDGTFGPFTESPVETPIELGVDDAIARIRMDVKTFHKSGAALAEVEVE